MGIASSPRGAVGARRVLVAVAVTAAVVAADQLTKWWAVTRLAQGRVHLVGTLDLELARNSGASFSLFQGKAFILLPVAVVLFFAVAGFVKATAPPVGHSIDRYGPKCEALPHLGARLPARSCGAGVRSLLMEE